MMIINVLIRKLGKPGYSLDSNLSSRDLLTILYSKFFALVRGTFLKPFFKHSQGFLFIGKSSRILFKHKISLGKTVTIGDNVQINALSIGGITLGDNVSISNNVTIECTGVIRELGEGLVVGNNVGIAQNCFIQVRGKIRIGNNVMIGPNVSIFSENHGYSSVQTPMINQPTSRIGVEIQDDVWLGTRSVILDGVKIGTGSIIAAGAVVTKSIPPFSVAVGVPARVVRVRV